MIKQKKLLCFTGGGLKGILQLKLLKKLDDNFNKNNIKNYTSTWIIDNTDIITATSVGTLCLFLILLRYEISDMIKLFDKVAEIVFKETLSIRLFGKDIAALFNNPYNSDLLSNELDYIIENSPLAKQILNKEIKIKGINNINGNNFYIHHLNDIYPNKEFYICSLQADINRIQVFTNKLGEDNDECNITSDAKLKEAIISSCSIPFYLKNKYFKSCGKFTNYVDGAVAGLNCPAHLGLLNKNDNYKVLIINAGTDKKGFTSKGIGGLLYMVGVTLSSASESQSFLLSYILTKGNVRSIKFKNTDTKKIGDPFSIKDYKIHKEMLNTEGYLENILNQNNSVNNLFDIENQDEFKSLNNYEWIRNFFFYN